MLTGFMVQYKAGLSGNSDILTLVCKVLTALFTFPLPAHPTAQVPVCSSGRSWTPTAENSTGFSFHS